MRLGADATGPSTQRDPIGLAGGLNQYGYAGGDPINNSDPFGLSSDTTRSPQDTLSRRGQQPTPSPFGEPRLGYYEKQREMHLGGMVTGLGVTPEGEYTWSVGIDGEPQRKATLHLTRRNVRPASVGRTEHVYSGYLQADGARYPAQMNLFSLGGVTWGFIDVTPP